MRSEDAPSRLEPLAVPDSTIPVMHDSVHDDDDFHNVDGQRDVDSHAHVLMMMITAGNSHCHP